MLGDHYMWGKEGYFDQAYHIPLIIRDPRRTADAGRGEVVGEFTEAIDLMPTILEWLGLESAQCDGRSLIPFLRGESPPAWRQEAHWEFDFRDPVDERSGAAFGLGSDQCGLAVFRGRRHKYVHFAALPPLFFDLERTRRAGQSGRGPAYREIRLDRAGRMLSWRMDHAERVLANHIVTTEGLVMRNPMRR